MNERSIWKYIIETNDDIQNIKMPSGANILHVDMQGPTICMWALVNKNALLESRYFKIHGTGHPVNERIKEHLGTVIEKIEGITGSLVWHIFEVFDDCSYGS